jgi:hypothetical protein
LAFAPWLRKFKALKPKKISIFDPRHGGNTPDVMRHQWVHYLFVTVYKKTNKAFNVRIKELILILSIIAFLGFTYPKPEIIFFCDNFNSIKLDSCEGIINNYFKTKEHNKIPIIEYSKRFPELDSLISDLSKLPCIDSCFYKDGRGAVMESNPPMLDISIYKINLLDTSKFILRIRFDHPLKVVWLQREYH